MDLFWSLSHTISSLLSYFWQVLDAISPFLVLIASVTAAIAAIWAFKLSRRILYYQLLSRYSSPEMGEALDIIWRFSRLREEEGKVFLNIVKIYRNKEDIHFKYDGEFQRSFLLGLEYKEINQARRQLSYFFMTTFDMFTKKDLDKASFQKICAYDSFELLYRVVEWFELALNPHYAREKWTDLLKQSGRKDIEDLKKQRPPGTWTEIEQMMQPKQEQA